MHTDGQKLSSTGRPYKDVLLNIPVISLLSPKHCYYDIYLSDDRNLRQLTVCTPAWDWRTDGTWRRWDEPKHRNVIIIIKKNAAFSKSLFTAAQATGTQNKHQTVKNTALNTLLGGVRQLADRNKRNRGCTERAEPTWCCHGNRIPLWWWETNLERVRAEDGEANTQSHHLYPPLPLQLIKEKKTSWLNSFNSFVIHL